MERHRVPANQRWAIPALSGGIQKKKKRRCGTPWGRPLPKRGQKKPLVRDRVYLVETNPHRAYEKTPASKRQVRFPEEEPSVNRRCDSRPCPLQWVSTLTERAAGCRVTDCGQGRGPGTHRKGRFRPGSSTNNLLRRIALDLRAKPIGEFQPARAPRKWNREGGSGEHKIYALRAQRRGRGGEEGVVSDRGGRRRGGVGRGDRCQPRVGQARMLNPSSHVRCATHRSLAQGDRRSGGPHADQGGPRPAHLERFEGRYGGSRRGRRQFGPVASCRNSYGRSVFDQMELRTGAAGLSIARLDRV